LTNENQKRLSSVSPVLEFFGLDNEISWKKILQVREKKLD